MENMNGLRFQQTYQNFYNIKGVFLDEFYLNNDQRLPYRSHKKQRAGR